MLVYGIDDHPGIDVPDSNYPNVELFLKSLFRLLKQKGFDIRINHWGSIFLIDPERKIPIALSINKTVAPVLPLDWEERLKLSPYFRLVSAKDYLSMLVLSYRAWRPGTKWRYLELEQNSAGDVENILSEMKSSLSSLVSSPRRSLSMRGEVTVNDVVTLLTYNHIKFNGRNHMPAWMQKINTRWFDSCEINAGYLHLYSRLGTDSYCLSKSDIALLKKILPEVKDERVCIDSMNRYS